MRLAVVAHIRHTHTRYDELLMAGANRQDARASIAVAIDDVLMRWKGAGTAASLWKKRRDLPDFAAARRSWDRG